ncbi:MAG: ECF-type sigma factor [Pseudomonadota bacterium]
MNQNITQLLERFQVGDDQALNRLAELIYPELKAMARRRANKELQLNATALVNETFLKLLSGSQVSSENRQQFFGLAATIMRQVIVDEVRHAAAQKRNAPEATFSDSMIADESQHDVDLLLQIDRLVEQLAREDKRLAHTFECRYFAGFSMAETAEVVGVSERTAERLWSQARERIGALLRESDD